MLNPRAARHHAAWLLERAGAPGNGIPHGFTWGQANKLTDDDLRSLLRGPALLMSGEPHPLMSGEPHPLEAQNAVS